MERDEQKPRDWGRVGLELLAYAERCAAAYRWRTGGSWDLAAGWTPSDVVQRVIEKHLDGSRRYDPSRGSFLPWLKMQIRSVMSAQALSAASRHETDSIVTDDGDDRLEWTVVGTGGSGRSLRDRPDNPEQILIRRETPVESDILGDLLESIAGDSELEEYVQAILLDGCEPQPRFVSEWLGVPVESVYGRLKRLRRLTRREPTHEGATETDYR